MKKLPYFNVYPADELNEQKRLSWNDQQWGWWTRIKYVAWLQDPQGRLEFDDDSLGKIALRPEKFDKVRWESVISCFVVKGGYLIDPDRSDLLTQVAKKSAVGRSNAKIRWAKDALEKAQKAGDSELAAKLQAEFDELKAGKSPKPAPKPRNRPKKSASQPNSGSRSEYLPSEAEQKAAAADSGLEFGPETDTPADKITFCGFHWYRGELEGWIKTAEKKLKNLDLKNRGGNFVETAKARAKFKRITEKISEAKACLKNKLTGLGASFIILEQTGQIFPKDFENAAAELRKISARYNEAVRYEPESRTMYVICIFGSPKSNAAKLRSRLFVDAALGPRLWTGGGRHRRRRGRGGRSSG